MDNGAEISRKYIERLTRKVMVESEVGAEEEERWLIRRNGAKMQSFAQGGAGGMTDFIWKEDCAQCIGAKTKREVYAMVAGPQSR